MREVEEAYQANYDKIAQDHIAHWRETGGNPFQDPTVLRANEDATLELITTYTKSDDRILDAGCGMGDLLLRLPLDTVGYGVDISDDYLRIARERGLNVTRENLERLSFRTEFFDVVVATDVLEHVLDLNAVIRELLRVLATGGILIVRTPNEEPLAIETDAYEFVHLRRFDQPTLVLLFQKIFGCEVLETPVSGDVVHAVVRK